MRKAFLLTLSLLGCAQTTQIEQAQISTETRTIFDNECVRESETSQKVMWPGLVPERVRAVFALRSSSDGVYAPIQFRIGNGWIGDCPGRNRVLIVTISQEVIEDEEAQ